MQTKLLINGELTSGAGKALPVLDPATGETVCEVNEASPEQVEAATKSSEAAFGSWSQTTPAERSALLLQLADAMEAASDEPGELESIDCGKPLDSARADEMPLSIDVLHGRGDSIGDQLINSPQMTVVANVNNDAEIACREIFGPVDAYTSVRHVMVAR